MSLRHHHLYLQRLSQFGQWVNIAPLTLGQLTGRLFQPLGYLPKGVSHIRVFLTVNQAGNGLLAALSGSRSMRFIWMWSLPFFSSSLMRGVSSRFLRRFALGDQKRCGLYPS